ncbi:hypothetical protein AB6A40_004661 [Gnathostoma spinigerum]|uniref:ShKT domain-containing protein n=1 Tax=Gnathostoma spinigerum TaxID=75299 RepID=A0ABD6EFA7_9BILA
MLSDDERRRFHWAIQQLKKSGEFSKLAVIHAQAALSGGAHSGPAFLGWHREFMKRAEFAIRQLDPELAIPYWDSTMDSVLPRPADSVMWTDELMGATDSNGFVSTGDFANFVTFENHPHVTRSVGTKGSPFTEDDINYVLSQYKIENILAYTAPQQGCPYKANFYAPEYTHGNVHIFVGGDMYDPYTSGNDPIFYIHHTFLDFMWEMFRQQRQSRYERENVYPPDIQVCSSAQHFASAPMRPFDSLRNVDGLSNRYTDNLYEYAPRPSCQDGPNCGSKYLFCDRSHGSMRCASKARVGGRCDGFVNGEDVCYNSICISGYCAALTPFVATTQPVFRYPPAQIQIVPIQSNCFNEHECCAFWASQGECRNNAVYMSEWCKVSCNKCIPTFNPHEECSDHHKNCVMWSRKGECTRNPLWMSENCRKSCAKCDRTRHQTCSSWHFTTLKPQVQLQISVAQNRGSLLDFCATDGCYNEDICCPLWGLQGQCSTNATSMACMCRVTCGLCIPDDYNYGTCTNYHRNCQMWASKGECQKNPWMLENCRHSCRSCFLPWELRQKCRINVGVFPGPSALFLVKHRGASDQQNSFDYI